MKNVFLLFTVLCTTTLSVTANAQSWKLTGNSGTVAPTNFLGTTDNKPILIETNKKERMRITATGLVGIGSKTPAGILNVDGGSYLTLTNPGYAVVGNVTGYNVAMDPYELQARYNGSYSSLYLNNYGGTVYMGNSTSSYFGAVAYGSNYGLYGASGDIGVYGTGTSYGVYGSGTNVGGYFYSSNGVGVKGYDGGNSQGVFGYEAGNGEALHGEAFGTVGYGCYGYSSQYYGVVGITSNSSSYAGYFQGNVYTTGLYQSSDETLKKNITDVSSGMSIINQLLPKQYLFKQDGNYRLMNLPLGEHYGLLAQDVEKVLPNLVKETRADFNRNVPDESTPGDPKQPLTKKAANTPAQEAVSFKALNYTELIPIMIKGMQEQQQTIQDDHILIAQQQKQISELKQMMNTLLNNAAASKTMGLGYLQQNTPNPFTAVTTIKCSLPAGTNKAQIIIYSNDGKALKTYSLSNKNYNEITLNAGELSAGAYRYSLIADNKVLDTKSMILTK